MNLYVRAAIAVDIVDVAFIQQLRSVLFVFACRLRSPFAPSSRHTAGRWGAADWTTTRRRRRPLLERCSRVAWVKWRVTDIVVQMELWFPGPPRHTRSTSFFIAPAIEHRSVVHVWQVAVTARLWTSDSARPARLIVRSFVTPAVKQRLVIFVIRHRWNVVAYITLFTLHRRSVLTVVF